MMRLESTGWEMQQSDFLSVSRYFLQDVDQSAKFPFAVGFHQRGKRECCDISQTVIQCSQNHVCICI